MSTRRIARAFRRRVRLGCFGPPLWAVLVSAVAIAAAAGQALGPVLAGNIAGTSQTQSTLTASQTVRLGAAPVEPVAATFTIEGETLTTTLAVDFAATANDDGTQFRVVSVVRVGQTAAFQFALLNASGKPANFTVKITAPPELDVVMNEVASSDVTQLARFSADTWLGTVASPAVANTTTDITVVYETKDDAKPGPYTFNATITQVSH